MLSGMPTSGMLIACQIMLQQAERQGPEHDDVADTLRRRAVSSAYYAIFHQVCGVIATHLTRELSEEDRTTVFEQAYRVLDHGRLKATAQRLVAQSSGGAPSLATATLRNFCTQLILLYDARQQADYSPAYTFSQAEATELVRSAEGLWGPFVVPDPPDGSSPLRSRLVVELLAPPKSSRRP